MAVRYGTQQQNTMFRRGADYLWHRKQHVDLQERPPYILWQQRCHPIPQNQTC
jgi:hypothetical protein